MPTLDRESRQLINAARTLGSGFLSVYLEDGELFRLCSVIATDLRLRHLLGTAGDDLLPSGSYYAMPQEWFTHPVAGVVQFTEIFLTLKAAEPDFPTYFKSLCELHKRRKKFQRILEHQAFPHIEQIAPRSLLEYGLKPLETLSSWLVWRKWLYDIDNRSAQETGYLFEPILAAALGGIPYAASKSPVKRADNPTKGRQVDCIDGRTAYEFKMRVTIAASGQGRFREELDFARDCEVSDYTPILLVLDPTPSRRLEDLSREYARYGGKAYVGDEAWKHIEDRAGVAMGIFIEKHIRVPLQELTDFRAAALPIRLEQSATEIEIRAGDTAFILPRSEQQVELVAEEDPETK